MEAWQDALAGTREFWLHVWGKEFVYGRHGMLLKEAEVNSDWRVSAMDESLTEPEFATGTWVEVLRLPILSMQYSADELAQLHAIAAERYVVAGAMTGSTGAPASAAGVVVEITFDVLGDQGLPVMVRSFGPLGLETDEASAVARATLFWERIELPGGWRTTEPDERNCAEEERLCKEAAKRRYEAARQQILGGTLAGGGGCITACAPLIADPPVWGACVAGCYILGLTAEALLLLAAEKQYEADLLDCERERTKCEAERQRRAARSSDVRCVAAASRSSPRSLARGGGRPERPDAISADTGQPLPALMTPRSVPELRSTSAPSA